MGFRPSCFTAVEQVDAIRMRNRAASFNYGAGSSAAAAGGRYDGFMRWHDEKPLSRGEYVLIGLLIALNLIPLATQAAALLRRWG